MSGNRPPRQLTVVCRPAAALAVAAIVGGCGPGPLDPTDTGGELLTGTDNVAYLGGRPFSLSPDHRRLVFSVEDPSDSQTAGDHVAFQLARLAAYVSYDLMDGSRTSVSVEDDVADLLRGGGGVLLGSGCWISGEGGRRVLLRDSFGRAIGFDPAAGSPAWEVVEIDRDELRAACPPQDPVAAPSEVIGPFRIEGVGSRRVRIVAADDPSTVYATHSAGAMSTELLVGHIRLSDDGRRLAYTITPALGSFVSNARAFMVDAGDPSASPEPLASPVYALEWAPDDPALYAVVERDGTTAIHRWILGEPRALSRFGATAPWTARVVENVTACTVDAVCYLGLELADTTITAIYGTGERPPPPCPPSLAVSDVAFQLQPGDTVEITVERCGEDGLFVEDIAR